MLNFKFELLQLQGAIKKQQLEIEKLQNDMQKLLNSKVKVSKLVKEQQKEFDKLKKENRKLQDVIYQKAKKKELSCMQEVEFTDENIAAVRNMAICMTKEQIARRFNMSLSTYLKREEQIPELKEAYECGKHEFMAEATSRLVEHIRNNDTKMLQYFMDNGMKFRQQDQNQEQTQITISQDFIDKKLKIVSDNLHSEEDYENEIAKKYHDKIMSITITKTSKNEDDYQ